MLGVVQVHLWGGGFIVSLSHPKAFPKLRSDEISFSCPNMEEKDRELFLFVK